MADDGFEGGEAVLKIWAGSGESSEGRAIWARVERDVDAMAGAGPRGFAQSPGASGSGRDGDAADEAEVDDVEWNLGIVAVAEGGEDVGFG